MNMFYFIRLSVFALIFSIVGGACSQKTDSFQISKDSSIEKEKINTSSSNESSKIHENLSNENESNTNSFTSKNSKAFDSIACNNNNIDDIYRQSKLDKLANIDLKQSDVEVRMGLGGGIGVPFWFIFQKKKNVTSAYLINPLEEGSDTTKKQIRLPKPTSGWKKFNAFLKSEGISIPLKFAESEKDYKDLDGVGGIAIEIKAGTKYDCRWYNYSSKKGDELDKILRSIAERFKMTKEFGYVPEN